jgi:hypothetical protein
MKKVLVCNNCGTENPFYSYICTNCKSFLRSKVANIDLWSTLWNLLDSPVQTSETIIHAEHKNFVGSILTLAGIKIGLSFLIIANALKLFGDEIDEPFNFILISAIIFVLTLLVISSVVTAINKSTGIVNRVKDNIALFAYSFLPIVLTLIVLTPIQLALYGIYWFTFNPSPILFKPMASYIIYFIEGLFFLWSLILLIVSTYSQSKNVFYSVVIGVAAFLILSLSLYYFVPIIY